MKRLEEGSGNTRIRKYAIAKDLTQSTVRLFSEAPAISVLDEPRGLDWGLRSGARVRVRV